MRASLAILFLLAGLACWTVLPGIDLMPSSDAATEWSLAGTLFVLFSMTLACEAVKARRRDRRRGPPLVGDGPCVLVVLDAPGSYLLGSHLRASRCDESLRHIGIGLCEKALAIDPDSPQKVPDGWVTLTTPVPEPWRHSL